MNVNKGHLRLKHILEEYFSTHKIMRIGKMYFRLYEPEKENIVSNYSQEDWNLIFSDATENDIKESSYCKNVTILIWCDVATDSSHGMVFLEENINIQNQISFHGGTWKYDHRYYFEVFSSAIYLFDILLDKGLEITTSCSIANNRAAKYQNVMGFMETERDEDVIYKKLNREAYRTSYVVNKLRI